MESLVKVYQKFEKSRTEKAKELIKRDVEPDPFCTFVAKNTDICPHKLISPLSQYLVESMFILDGEMSLSLPDKMENVPALFFDALGITRQARQLASKEDTAIEKNKH